MSAGEDAKGHSRSISVTELESSTVKAKQKTGYKMARISPKCTDDPKCEEVKFPWEKMHRLCDMLFKEK